MKRLIEHMARRPIGVSVVFLAICVFGAVALRELSVDMLPAIDVPQITVTTPYAGVAPAEIETLITRPIEQSVSTIGGLDRIEGESSEGLSRVRLQFGWGTSLETALDDVRIAVDRVRTRLPEDSEPPSILKFDLASVPIMQLGLTGSSDMRKLKYLAGDALSRALERVVGVAAVQVDGGRDREIRVALSSDRLEALAISAEDVARALGKENRNVSAGDMRDSGREVVIRTAGEFVSLEEIGGVVVATRDGHPVRVADLGEVVDTIREINNELWIDGKPGIRLQIYKQSGANTVEVATRAREEIERLNELHGERANLSVLWDASTFVTAAVDNVSTSAWQGGLLAAVILLMFLRSVRATLLVLAALPISIIATFALMHFAGMTLNIVSFGGIALGIGMMIDCAIVVLESIHKKQEDGSGAFDAAVDGTAEVAGPVIAGTLTTIAVFAPVLFLGALAGVLFGELALVVAFTNLCGLAVALSLVPMIAARMLKHPAAPATEGRWARISRALEHAFVRVEELYGRLLRTALAAPWAVVAGSLVLLATSVAFSQHIKFELLPQADEGLLDVDLELAAGTPLETTSTITREAEKRIVDMMREGELAHVITSVGPESWWRPGGSHEGEVELTLAPKDQRNRSLTDIEAATKKALADIPLSRLRVRQRSTNQLTRIIRRGEDRLTVEIRGHDPKTADALAVQILPAVRDVSGVGHAEISREFGKLERVIHVDRARAAEIGLGSAEVASAVEHYILGRVATRLREGGDEFDVRVQLADSDRQRLELLPSLPLVTPSGQRVALGALVRIEEAQGPASIKRIDQERVLPIDVGVVGAPLGEVAGELREQMATISAPEGFDIVVSGELDEQGKTFYRLLIGILLACFLVYATMAVQFESLRQPLIVMASVPFAFIGAVAVLLLSSTTFSMTAFLGAILLVGIVVANAIVLVDCANQLRDEQGLDVVEALVAAGKRRLRPILMTTLTTVIGLAPLALSAAEGSEMQAPMARVVMGGMTSSTLVTLLLIPCLYLLTEGKRRRAPSTAEALTPTAGARRLDGAPGEGASESRA
jgi:HAE1 family hydrophobic/amphiphilic exporter-1